MTMAKPDWEAIESAYRAGVMSLREIASQHGISEGAIRKRAKRDDWSRDLNAKVKERADDLVRKAEVRKQVRTETVLSERVLIEATAEVVATVRMEHRGDIRRARELTNTLFDELAGECGDVAALEQLGEMMRREDDKGMDRLNDLYNKIISLPSRVKSMKDLSDSLKTLIGLEREAYSIDNKVETKEVTHNVMLVPTSDSVDAWEAAALKQQDEVLGG
nr:MAG TPA_asm: Terminase small subunit [Caudoviricetes sp.]